MPSQVRIIAGPRNTSFDSYIRDLVEQDGFGVERTYFGITEPDRAETVRRRMKRAGTHLGVSVKAFWKPCKGCSNGGKECRFHVLFTAYDPEQARQYKQKQAPPSATPRH